MSLPQMEMIKASGNSDTNYRWNPTAMPTDNSVILISMEICAGLRDARPAILMHADILN